MGIDIKQLADPVYIDKNISEIYDTAQAANKALEIYKQWVKEAGVSQETAKYTIKYIVSNKIVPTNMDTILQTYPIHQYPEIYNISLSAKAGDVIKEEGLVTFQPVEQVRFLPLNKADDINKSDDTGEIPNM